MAEPDHQREARAGSARLASLCHRRLWPLMAGHKRGRIYLETYFSASKLLGHLRSGPSLTAAELAARPAAARPAMPRCGGRRLLRAPASVRGHRTAAWHRRPMEKPSVTPPIGSTNKRSISTSSTRRRSTRPQRIVWNLEDTPAQSPFKIDVKRQSKGPWSFAYRAPETPDPALRMSV